MGNNYCETCIYRTIHEFDNDECINPENIGIVSTVTCDFGCVRHKPITLHEGDWVVYDGNIHKVHHITSDHIYIKEHVYVLEDECTKWEPEEGQLCFNHHGTEVAIAIKYKKGFHSTVHITPCPDDIEHFLPN